MRHCGRTTTLVGHAVGRPLLALVVCASIVSVANAQTRSPQRGHSRHQSDDSHCRIICAPGVALLPGVIRSHLAKGPRVRSTSTGEEHQLAGTSNLELIVVVAAPTAVPRLSVFGSVQWLPNASESRNPFTLYNASELGTSVRANTPTVTMGGSVALLPAARTDGWVDLGANIADLYSQAARPTDRSAYTHKLELDLVAHLHAFSWMPTATYLHRVSVYAILDYVGTGLPRAGDAVPPGRVFVSAARPLALITGLSLPLSPVEQ